MAGIYSTRFLELANGGSGSFTVPAGQVAVIRSISVFNGGAGGNSFNVSIQPGPIVVIAAALPAPGGEGLMVYSYLYDLRAVVKASEQITCAAGAGLNLTCSGYLFEA